MKTIHDIKLGDTESMTKTFVDADVVLFACMTGDFNPAHISREFAVQNRLKDCVVHNMLVAGLVNSVLGTRLPGPGSLLNRQNLAFLAPVYIGDTITARVEVAKCNHAGSQALLSVECKNQYRDVVVRGDVLMDLPEFVESGRSYRIEGMEIHA